MSTFTVVHCVSSFVPSVAFACFVFLWCFVNRFQLFVVVFLRFHCAASFDLPSSPIFMFLGLCFVTRFRLICCFLLCFHCAPWLDVIVVTFIVIIRLCFVTRFGLLLVVFVCFHYAPLLDVLSSFHIFATTPLLRRSKHSCNATFPQQLLCSGGHNICAKVFFQKQTVFRRPTILAMPFFSSKQMVRTIKASVQIIFVLKSFVPAANKFAKFLYFLKNLGCSGGQGVCLICFFRKTPLFRRWIIKE